MFVAFLAAILCLVIFGGILTVQGFQARVKADYEKRDKEQEALVTERINTMLTGAEQTLDGIASNDVLRKAFFKVCSYRKDGPHRMESSARQRSC